MFYVDQKNSNLGKPQNPFLANIFSCARKVRDTITLMEDSNFGANNTTMEKESRSGMSPRVMESGPTPCQ